MPILQNSLHSLLHYYTTTTSLTTTQTMFAVVDDLSKARFMSQQHSKMRKNTASPDNWNTQISVILKIIESERVCSKYYKYTTSMQTISMIGIKTVSRATLPH